MRLVVLVTMPIGYVNVTESEGKPNIEDGPYGGSGGDAWTDGGEVHLNGPITSFRYPHYHVVLQLILTIDCVS